MVIVGGPEAGVAMAEGVLERVVQHGRAHVEEGLHGGSVPAHLLLLIGSMQSCGVVASGRQLRHQLRDRLKPGGWYGPGRKRPVGGMG